MHEHEMRSNPLVSGGKIPFDPNIILTPIQRINGRDGGSHGSLQSGAWKRNCWRTDMTAWRNTAQTDAMQTNGLGQKG